MVRYFKNSIGALMDANYNVLIRGGDASLLTRRADDTWKFLYARDALEQYFAAFKFSQPDPSVHVFKIQELSQEPNGVLKK